MSAPQIDNDAALVPRRILKVIAASCVDRTLLGVTAKLSSRSSTGFDIRARRTFGSNVWPGNPGPLVAEFQCGRIRPV